MRSAFKGHYAITRHLFLNLPIGIGCCLRGRRADREESRYGIVNYDRTAVPNLFKSNCGEMYVHLIGSEPMTGHVWFWIGTIDMLD